MRGYTRSSISPRCALKIDLKKAFDSVSWRYLISLMLAFGFPLHFVLWIATCIASPYFSVVVNGSLVGYFPGAKGVRQGDALSPYLFVLTMDLLICDAWPSSLAGLFGLSSLLSWPPFHAPLFYGWSVSLYGWLPFFFCVVSFMCWISFIIVLG